jgi:hypothetical protein
MRNVSEVHFIGLRKLVVYGGVILGGVKQDNQKRFLLDSGSTDVTSEI